MSSKYLNMTASQLRSEFRAARLDPDTATIQDLIDFDEKVKAEKLEKEETKREREEKKDRNQKLEKKIDELPENRTIDEIVDIVRADCKTTSEEDKAKITKDFDEKWAATKAALKKETEEERDDAIKAAKERSLRRCADAIAMVKKRRSDRKTSTPSSDQPIASKKRGASDDSEPPVSKKAKAVHEAPRGANKRVAEDDPQETPSVSKRQKTSALQDKVPKSINSQRGRDHTTSNTPHSPISAYSGSIASLARPTREQAMGMGVDRHPSASGTPWGQANINVYAKTGIRKGTDTYRPSQGVSRPSTSKEPTSKPATSKAVPKPSTGKPSTSTSTSSSSKPKLSTNRIGNGDSVKAELERKKISYLYISHTRHHIELFDEMIDYLSSLFKNRKGFQSVRADQTGYYAIFNIIHKDAQIIEGEDVNKNIKSCDRYFDKSKETFGAHGFTFLLFPVLTTFERKVFAKESGGAGKQSAGAGKHSAGARKEKARPVKEARPVKGSTGFERCPDDARPVAGSAPRFRLP